MFSNIDETLGAATKGISKITNLFFCSCFKFFVIISIVYYGLHFTMLQILQPQLFEKTPGRLAINKTSAHCVMRVGFLIK